MKKFAYSLTLIVLHSRSLKTKNSFLRNDWLLLLNEALENSYGKVTFSPVNF